MTPEPMQQFDEAEALTRLQKGDLSAFEYILSRYERPLYNYIYRMLNQRQDAEDVTQEVFLKVFKHHTDIDMDKNFKAWLYTIATRTTYDWLRKRRRHPELFIIDDPEANFETISPDTAYDDIERLDSAHDLAVALGRIKPAYQAVITLYYQQEFSYQEIADMLSLPLNTVKTYLRRGKQALQKELHQLYADPT